MRFPLTLAAILLAASALCPAQSAPERGSHELQIWATGGHSIAGGTSRTGVFNAGLRYGWVLTDPHLPGILRGRFEYALDATPIFLIFQPANTAYGVGFSPLVLKWNFERRGRLSPYLELNGGVLATDHNVPPPADNVNFTSAAALGTHVLGEKYNWSIELRYMHISNAGLVRLNPGINTLQVRVGVGKFFRRR